MSKVKEVSAYNGSTWSDAVPIGANDANIDITSSTTSTYDSDDTSTLNSLYDSTNHTSDADVTVSSGDTGATAWSKFNRFRKRIVNNFSNYIAGSLVSSSNSAWNYSAAATDSNVYTAKNINYYLNNVIGYNGIPSDGTVASQLSALNSNLNGITITEAGKVSIKVIGLLAFYITSNIIPANISSNTWHKLGDLPSTCLPGKPVNFPVGFNSGQQILSFGILRLATDGQIYYSMQNDVNIPSELSTVVPYLRVMN